MRDLLLDYDLPGYDIIGQISANSRSIVFRGYATDDGKQVIITVPKENGDPGNNAALLIHGCEVARNINAECIIKPLKLERAGQFVAMISEDTGAVSLRKFLQTYPVGLQTFLDIGIRLAKAVSRLHQKGVIHRDIKPENILISPDTLKVYIIDFGLSTLLPIQSNQNHGIPIGSLEYMPPEQTGRLNMAVDQRSDLYSLGIVFYELLAGMLPLQARNPAEWIYAHMTRRPKPLTEVNPEIPRAVSGIVMKLLEKAAESRYQNAYGLLRDLEECKSQLDEKGIIEPFPIGRFDVSVSIQLPQKLYGRNAEKNTLKAAFDAAMEGRAVSIMVSGYPGIGKTMLINDSMKSMVYGKGYFITGKFDQLEKNIPYAPIASAFGSLVKQLLTESRENLDLWKKRILNAVGAKATVVSEVLPELVWLIGQQNPVDILPPKEAESRFLMVFTEFIKVFARSGHPLVLFIDDLHWADLASINLIKHLTQDADLHSFLFIGAFRENEVDIHHPLMKVLRAGDNKQSNIRHISVKPLKINDVAQMMKELLKTRKQNVIALSKVLYRKVGGNPLFLRQLITAIHDEGYLYFDINEGHWKWKLKDIQDLKPGADVLNLILKKLQRIPQKAREIIRLAACIGNRFGLETLAAIYGRSTEETASELLLLVQEGLILPVENEDVPASWQDREQHMFEFLHDRIQQAVYSAISDEDKMGKHLAIGRLLLQTASENPDRTKNRPLSQQTASEYPDRTQNRPLSPENILSIMDHFNRSLALIREPGERIKLAGYNLLAGKKAKASAAYMSALKYFKAGKELLPDNSWGHCYKLSYDLYLELAQMEYISGNVDTAEKLFDIVMEKAADELERASVSSLKIMLYAGAGRYTEAVNTGIWALGNLGMKIPVHPAKSDYVRELMWYKWHMRNKKINDLALLPEMKCPKQKKIAELLARLSYVTMCSYPTLYSYVILKTGNHAVQYGNTEMTAVGYIGYSITAGSILGDYKAAEKYGEVSVQLVERYDKNLSKCIIYFVYGTLISHWTRHASFGMDYLEKSALFGKEAGDVLVIGYALCVLLEHRFLTGAHLEKIAEESHKNSQIAKKLKHDNLAINAAIYEVTASILLGTDPLTSCSQVLESDELAQLVKKDDKTTLATFYIRKTQIYYMAGDCKRALVAAKQVDPLSGSIFGFLISVEYIFYYSLAITAAYEELSREEQKQYRKVLKKNLKLMKEWADFCRENFEHKHLLIAAETAGLHGKKEEAMSLYERAIESARENGYIQNEALANELAARFYLSQGLKKIARTYMLDAFGGYNRWGAVAKAEELKSRYPQLLNGIGIKGIDVKKDQAAAVEMLEKLRTIYTPVESDAAARLDRYFIDKAVDNISQETDIDRLLEKFLDIAVKSTGADKGCLVFERDGELFVEAIKDNAPSVTTRKTIVLKECNAVSKSIIRYVARTLETVVLNHKEEAGIFAGDCYIAEAGTKSIACLPLLLQSIPFGVLYLENSLLPGVFSADRLEILKLLSAQVAYMKSLQSYLQEDTRDTRESDDKTNGKLVDSLTKRETEVPSMIAAGHSNKEIADRLEITMNTAKTHIKNIYGKLQVNRRVQAVERAKKLNLL